MVNILNHRQISCNVGKTLPAEKMTLSSSFLWNRPKKTTSTGKNHLMTSSKAHKHYTWLPSNNVNCVFEEKCAFLSSLFLETLPPMKSYNFFVCHQSVIFLSCWWSWVYQTDVFGFYCRKLEHWLILLLFSVSILQGNKDGYNTLPLHTLTKGLWRSVWQ